MKNKLATCKNWLMILTIAFSMQSCYHYRVLTTESDPATEYQSKILKSYAWGLINSPKDFVVPNCNNNNAIDEVLFSRNFGQAMLTLITLGIYCPSKVEWRCHKPPHSPGEL